MPSKRRNKPYPTPNGLVRLGPVPEQHPDAVQRQAAQDNCDFWNACFPPGTPVIVTQTRGSRVHYYDTHTTGWAYVSCGRSAMVQTAALAGPFFLNHVKPLVVDPTGPLGKLPSEED